MKPPLVLISTVLVSALSIGFGHGLNVTVYDDRISLPETLESGYVR